jgi:hypothetical protein
MILTVWVAAREFGKFLESTAHLGGRWRVLAVVFPISSARESRPAIRAAAGKMQQRPTAGGDRPNPRKSTTRNQSLTDREKRMLRKKPESGTGRAVRR